MVEVRKLRLWLLWRRRPHFTQSIFSLRAQELLDLHTVHGTVRAAFSFECQAGRPTFKNQKEILSR